MWEKNKTNNSKDQQTENRINPMKQMPKYIIINLLKTKYKIKILKATREKKHILYRTIIQITMYICHKKPFYRWENCGLTKKDKRLAQGYPAGKCWSQISIPKQSQACALNLLVSLGCDWCCPQHLSLPGATRRHSRDHTTKDDPSLRRENRDSCCGWAPGTPCTYQQESMPVTAPSSCASLFPGLSPPASIFLLEQAF